MMQLQNQKGFVVEKGTFLVVFWFVPSRVTRAAKSRDKQHPEVSETPKSKIFCKVISNFSNLYLLLSISLLFIIMRFHF